MKEGPRGGESGPTVADSSAVAAAAGAGGAAAGGAAAGDRAAVFAAESGGAAGASGSNSSGSSDGTAGLTAGDIEQIVGKVQRQCGNGLNAAQVSALRAELKANGSQLIAPGTAWSPIRSASVGTDGTAFVW